MKTTNTITIPVKAKVLTKQRGIRYKIAIVLFSLGGRIAKTKVEVTVGE